MKKILLSSICILLFFLSSYSQYTRRDLLTRNASADEIASMVSNFPAWREESRKKILERLNALSPQIKASLIHNAEKHIDYTWPALPAWNYLDFVRNGNRTVYQTKWSERREILNNLVAAELVENKGRFLPQIVNGIWALCEESTWCYPAHISAQGKSGLPDPNQNIIDLGAGETSLNLSWIYLMLHSQLEKISPVIPQRIQFELNRRIIQPYLNVNFWWMGFPYKKVNNWNIWINRNMLYTIALTGDKDSTSLVFIDRLLHSADNFINSYGDDGGCEEGTHYWEAAPGYMIQLIDLVKDISKGKIDISQEPLIKRMGQYIYKMHIDKGYFVDFADASPVPHLPPLVIFNYGSVIRDSVMMKFGSYLASIQNFSKSLDKCVHLFNYFEDLLLRDDILNTPPAEPFVLQSWFPDLQQMTQRDNGSNAEGLFLAGKGGVNGVSHAHNDVGNFIIYVDGNPAIVDAGVGTYTAKTFSSQRYDIWTMQSAWHNLPTINGVQQKDGSKYKAEDVHYNTSGNRTVFELNIAKAYPDAARVKSWKRSLTFNRYKNIVLQENYELKEFVSPFMLSLLTPLDVTINKNVIILKGISLSGESYGLKLKYDSRKFDVEVEDKKMDDETLKRLWPKDLRRIKFISKGKAVKGGYKITFEKL